MYLATHYPAADMKYIYDKYAYRRSIIQQDIQFQTANLRCRSDCVLNTDRKSKLYCCSLVRVTPLVNVSCKSYLNYNLFGRGKCQFNERTP